MVASDEKVPYTRRELAIPVALLILGVIMTIWAVMNAGTDNTMVGPIDYKGAGIIAAVAIACSVGLFVLIPVGREEDRMRFVG